MPRAALRKSHINIRLNDKSAKMERRLDAALEKVRDEVLKNTGLTLVQQKTMMLSDIVAMLNKRYGKDLDIDFERAVNPNINTYLQPDGGFWYVKDWGEPKRWVLIAETKRQGTNDAREREGKPQQSRGNAVERLGKNMRGFDALFLGEMITPFVCFGEGCDLQPESSILDRVATLNSFFPLNKVFVEKVKLDGGEILRPASLYFRADPRSPAEMVPVLLEVAQKSIDYYRKTYGL